MKKNNTDAQVTLSGNGDFSRFDDAMGKLLKVSKSEIGKRMAEEKKAKPKRRKAG
jgi:hypothetical protein